MARTPAVDEKLGPRPICDASHVDAGGAALDSPKRLSVDDLDLVDCARKAAETLVSRHTNIVFTSGRRTVKQQANAMAGNVARKRKWMEQTYMQSAERTALQTWVDNHPEATARAEISAGLEAIMNNWTDAQKGNLSRHFCGKAFDIQPVANGDEIKKTIGALPNLRKFLDSEGGLTIWHADFEES
jgi:hypothetical protein